MQTAQQFTAEERRTYIGGSDIAAVLGKSRWKTPLKLWLEKTGQCEPPDLSNNEAVQLGTELEDFVAQKFSREQKLPVRIRKEKYVHKDFPFLVAHIDRIIPKTKFLLECKTCSAWKKDEWAGNEIPIEYIYQVIWNLGISGRKIGYIAVLIGGQTFKTKKILFDEELFSQMVQAAVEFWDNVQDNLPPAITADDCSTLVELYPKERQDAEFITDDELEIKIKYREELRQEGLEIKSKREQIENELKEIIKDKIGILTPNYKVTWKTSNTLSLDEEKLKEEDFDTYSVVKDYLKVSTSLDKDRLKKEDTATFMKIQKYMNVTSSTRKFNVYKLNKDNTRKAA